MPTNSFTVNVPKNTVTPISKVVMTLSLTDENAATFTITDPQLSVHTFAALSPPMPPSPAVTDSFNFPAPAGIPRQDRAVITRNPAPVGDPQRATGIINLNLNTDVDPAAGCASSMPTASEQWVVSVAGTQISGVCQVSLTRTSVSGCIGANANVLIDSTNPADLATIDGKANQKCALENRPTDDVVLVLDRSGSMGTQDPPPAPPNETRIKALHQAVQNFVTVWSDLLASGDRIGIVTFDDQIENPLWDTISFSSLQPFNSSIETTVITNIDTVTERGATSIGGGLAGISPQPGKGGAVVLTQGGPNDRQGRRQVILLMSDGQQNTDPFVGVPPFIGVPPPPPNQPVPVNYNVVTYNQADIGNPNNYNPLPGLSPATPYQIYTVTIGPDSQVPGNIMQLIAQATGGFYLNSEAISDALNPFFLELLANFVHFNSWETARLIHGSVSSEQPHITKMPFSTTTQKVICALSWPANEEIGGLRLRVEPPAISSPPIIFEESSQSGLLKLSFDPAGLLDPIGDWTVTVEIVPPPIFELRLRRENVITEDTIEFDLAVLVDDLAVKSELTVIPLDYKAGDQIKLEARLSVFSEPVENLGANAGDELLVQVVQPGQSVGDLLSDSTASTQPPPNADHYTPVQAKLLNMLQGNPGVLGRNDANPNIILLQQTSPGVYTGTYDATVYGHYNFLFGIQGLTNGAGRFSRQMIKTVRVRAYPEAGTTDIQTSISPAQHGNLLTITFTPRTKLGHRMGPGWANYFWFTAPGNQPFKANDNMDGTYTATMGFTGLLPPSVSLHFIDVFMIIDDSVTPDQLPIPLDDSTVLVPCVLKPEPALRIPYISTWLVLGPIFDPAHQLGTRLSDNYPCAGAIIQDIDEHQQQLDPIAITKTLDKAPRHGDTVCYGGGAIFRERVYAWKERYFEGLDWENISDIGDDIHMHLSGDYGDDPFDPHNYLNFAGKHHALAFFLVYIISPDKRTTPIGLRHDDAIRMWLNGKEIKRDGVIPFTQDHDIIDESESCVPVTLQQGNNILLVAVAETHMAWAFSARIADYEGLRFTTDNPAKGEIAPCESKYQFISIVGKANWWNQADLNRALFHVGGGIWKGRVRMGKGFFKIVAHGDWGIHWWGSHGANLSLDNFHNDIPGIYEVIFNENDPANPILILVKPFSGEHR